MSSKIFFFTLRNQVMNTASFGSIKYFAISTPALIRPLTSKDCLPPSRPPALPPSPPPPPSATLPTEHAVMVPETLERQQQRPLRGTQSVRRYNHVLIRCLYIVSPLLVNCKFCCLLTVCSSGGKKKSYFGSLCQDKEN